MIQTGEIRSTVRAQAIPKSGRIIKQHYLFIKSWNRLSY